MAGNKEKKLLLIDGNSFLHRAYHVLPTTMKALDGSPTNAVFGFLRMLLKLLKDLKPTHVAVAFDVGKITFRNEMFPEYKANRDAMPEDLAAQVGTTKELLRAMDVDILEAGGFEADDVIGTIAGQAESMGMSVDILSGDRDFLQLVSDSVSLLFTKKGVSEIDEWNRERLWKEKGISPSQVVEKKGLEGDKSDNIPGVPGIGEKTALKLIIEFETVENLLNNLENVKSASLKRKLEDNADQARLSRELAAIRTDIPLELKIDSLELREFNPETFGPMLARLGFRSILEELGLDSSAREREAGGRVTVKSETAPPQWVTDKSRLEELARDLSKAGRIFINVFAASENYLDDLAEGIALAAEGIKPTAVLIGDEGVTPDEVRELLGPIIQDLGVAKLGHDLKRDWLFLKRLGLELANLDFDTRIAGYLLNPEEKRQEIEDLKSRYIDTGTLALFTEASDGRSRALRACDTVGLAADLAPVLGGEMDASGLDRVFSELEMPLVDILGRMQYNGVAIDRKKLEDLSEEFRGQEEEIEKQVAGIAGEEYNVRSPKQTAELLFERIGLPRIKGDSTSHDVLNKLKPLNPVVDLIISHREISKLRSTFVDGLIKSIHPRTGRLHTSFEQTVTATGRLSSREPNLQNIPIRTPSGKRIRRAFVAGSGKLISADYSQIELRILAHFSGDTRLMRAFQNDEDIHTLTAAEIFSTPPGQVTAAMRRRAKAVNFGIIYGMSAFGLAEQLEIPRAEADSYLKRYFEIYSGVKQYIEDTINKAREEGFAETLFGRRRALPELKSRNAMRRQFTERTAVNTPVQGTAADIMKLAMISVNRLETGNKLGVRTVLQIHDELLFEAPEDSVGTWAKQITEAMENVVDLEVPLKIDVLSGDNWLDMKPLSD